MKHATWTSAVMVGLVACSGTYIGGDLPGGQGMSGGASASGHVSAGATGDGHVAGGATGDGHVAGGATGDGHVAGGATGDGHVAGGAPSGEYSSGGAPTWTDTVPACISTIDAWIVFDAFPQLPPANPNSGAAGAGPVGPTSRDLYAIRPDGTQLTRLTTDNSMDWEPALSSDGSLLAFSSDREGGADIYVLNKAQHSVTKVTARGDTEFPSFSPDGSLLAFASNHSIYTVKPDGTGEKLIGPGDNALFIGNEELAVGQMTAPRGPANDAPGITAYRVDGSGSRTLVVGGVGDTGTGHQAVAVRSISPAGDEIAYVTYCDPATRLSILAGPTTGTNQACAGRPLAPVGDTHTYDDFASWGPNNAIVYTNGTGLLDGTRIILTGPDLTRCAVTTTNMNAEHPTWAPAGWQP